MTSHYTTVTNTKIPEIKPIYQISHSGITIIGKPLHYSRPCLHRYLRDPLMHQRKIHRSLIDHSQHHWYPHRRSATCNNLYSSFRALCLPHGKKYGNLWDYSKHHINPHRSIHKSNPHRNRSNQQLHHITHTRIQEIHHYTTVIQT